MQHPDEGTIHSWLDGALPAEDAASLESHVATCQSCAAAVAEARGFIAASSRILTALDDVPRGVLPAVPSKKRDFRVLWRAAAAMLVGEHDFSAFRSSECQAKTPVRTMFQLEVTKAGDTIDFVLRANAFLHHMVRNIVGTLVYVGKGKHPPGWVEEVLQAKERSKAAPTFGPEGLVLEKIEYESKWGLPG